MTVYGSAALSFTQEHRASAPVEGLKRQLALTCRVLRSGAEKIAPVDQIVPGDVVLLSAANLIPADGLVIEVEDFLVAQSAMTGKSFPVEKRRGGRGCPYRGAGQCGVHRCVGSKRVARVLAARTGRHTEFGAIAAQLRAHPKANLRAASGSSARC